MTHHQSRGYSVHQHRHCSGGIEYMYVCIYDVFPITRFPVSTHWIAYIPNKVNRTEALESWAGYYWIRCLCKIYTLLNSFSEMWAKLIFIITTRCIYERWASFALTGHPTELWRIEMQSNAPGYINLFIV